MDIRQSSFYATYMRKIGWVVERVERVNVFIKKFPLFGSVIKIQWPNKIPSFDSLRMIKKKYKARSISIELNHESGIKNRGLENFKINNSPYLPTKTIQIDLTPLEKVILKKFSEAKQRAVRKATKNGVYVREGTIEEFIALKKKDLWPFGRWFGKDTISLWESFPKENKAALIAYHSSFTSTVIPGLTQNLTRSQYPDGILNRVQDDKEEAVAGVFLLFYDKVAYYWMAASTNEGKKLFAPTLLVWEALRLAKIKNCNLFDFEGIYDPRFHNTTKNWKGFTKFKQGFGGEEAEFPKPLLLK